MTAQPGAATKTPSSDLREPCPTPSPNNPLPFFQPHPAIALLFHYQFPTSKVLFSKSAVFGSPLNFIGFPTPESGAVSFDDFLGPVPELQRKAEIYRYPGGDLGANNPVRVWSPLYRSVGVQRGEAFWIRASDAYNRYFGPVSVELQSGSGVHFGDSRGTYSLRLKNMTPTARTVTMDLRPSETPPSLQPAITATPPMLVRGALNTTNLTYHHTVLNSQQSFTLAAQGLPGSELEIVLGLNRSGMTASAGSLYAGILRLADTEGLSQIDLSITATVANTSGLWVGQADITQVGQYLKNYQRGADGLPVLGEITSTGAPYIATSLNTSLGAVARPYPLRLILFNEPANSVLLQRVYLGPGSGTNMLVATRESFLDSTKLSSVRRISATHLPYSKNNNFWTKCRVVFKTGQIQALLFSKPEWFILGDWRIESEV